MKIIDAHIHFSHIKAMKDTGSRISFVDYTPRGFIREYNENNITAAIGMGLSETKEYEFPDNNSESPMMLDFGDVPSNIYICPGVNPHKLSNKNLYEFEKVLENKNTVGIKIYAGYYHFDINDPVYGPVYEMAALFKLPVVIHTGDTYSAKALLIYSQPLLADRLAREHRNINFILAHMGDPWIMDATEVAYKNENVFMDISGLIEGDEEKIGKIRENRILMDHYKLGPMFLNNYRKILFGTDWPLVPVKSYMEFIMDIIPEKYYEDVFYNNAARLFNLEGRP